MMTKSNPLWISLDELGLNSHNTFTCFCELKGTFSMDHVQLSTMFKDIKLFSSISNVNRIGLLLTLVQMNSVDLIDSDKSSHEELLLHDSDFPEHFKEMTHPDDYKEIPYPLPLQTIFHRKAYHSRLILRISWKVGEGRFVPMSFVCDTGAPGFFYLCEKYILLKLTFYTHALPNS